MPKGFVYILECYDGSYYTGSTNNIEKRIEEHNSGKGANHTKKRLPVKLIYLEEFQRIDDAFYREKQIQGWSRKKKEALIKQNLDDLKKLSECMNDSHFKNSKDVISTSLNHQNSSDDFNSVAERSRSYSNGKLLLTGEYVVLDGALALALPTTYGQSLTVKSIDQPKIIWQSFDENNTIWFEGEFMIHKNEILTQAKNGTSEYERLLQILNAVKILNPSFFNSEKGYHITTKLNFSKSWGLGTSSTLINNIANWTNVDAYKLLELTFGGSGYDIACAQHNTAITYQLKRHFDCAQSGNRIIKEVNFNPKFSDCLYFVYLNKKQNSREGIAHYKNNVINNSIAISEISGITQNLIGCNSLNEFEILINKHEQIISALIKQETVKNILFKDFKGSVKSLGAWGGDFVLVTSTKDPSNYFKSKGFKMVISYQDMILNQKKSLT